MTSLGTVLLSTLVLTNAQELVRAVAERRIDAAFDVTATLTFPCHDYFDFIAIRDASGVTEMLTRKPKQELKDPKAGDLVRVTGSIRAAGHFADPIALCMTMTKLGGGAPLPPKPVSATELLSGACRGEVVSVRGHVIDAFYDEIDKRTFFLALNCAGETIYAAMMSTPDSANPLRNLNNAEVSVTGLCTDGGFNSDRRFSGYILNVFKPDDIRVMQMPTDPFDVPDIRLDDLPKAPSEILRLGRRRISGHVIAVWQGRQVILKTERNHRTTVSLLDNCEPPVYGQAVEAVGFVETDLYTINLSHAVWRPTNRLRDFSEDKPKSTEIPSLFTGARGTRYFESHDHGKTLRITGTVKSLDSFNRTFVVERDGFSISVDASGFAKTQELPAPGSVVSAAGTCVMTVDNWKQHSAFPHVRGMTLVMRTPADLTVLESPPWWTADRLLIVLGILFAVLVGIFVWNRVLANLIDHRSRQLLREEIARMHADVKLEERTRLAVELHDTLAQNLTGVALQIDATQLAAERDPASVTAYLETARRKMQNCRDNLRDCLWDLRSRVLDEKTLSGAIRKTLAPLLENATATVDCDIRCAELSDNSLHAVLSIVRELAINALRHGRARNLTVSGTSDGDRIALRVADDGAGFDPESRPGMREGHFGLQGVGERISRLGGAWTISSAPGRGCVVSITGLSANG